MKYKESELFLPYTNVAGCFITGYMLMCVVLLNITPQSILENSASKAFVTTVQTVLPFVGRAVVKNCPSASFTASVMMVIAIIFNTVYLIAVLRKQENIVERWRKFKKGQRIRLVLAFMVVAIYSLYSVFVSDGFIGSRLGTPTRAAFMSIMYLASILMLNNLAMILLIAYIRNIIARRAEDNG